MLTMKDVAKKANVGIATVSRVVNNSGFVSEDTRQIVLNAIDELGYVPNELARNFQKNKSNAVGVIVPSIDQSFTSTLLKEIEAYLQKLGYVMYLTSSNYDKAVEEEYIDKLKSQQVAGIIVTAPLSSAIEQKISKLPIVSFDRTISTIPFVHTNNYEGGKFATEKLIENGCKKLLYLGFGADENSLSQKRQQAFIDVCTEKNIEFETVDYEVSDEYVNTYIDELVVKASEFDGLFFGCDYLAQVYLGNINKAEVLAKTKIISFDGLPRNSNYKPLLTTIGHNYPLIAKTLVDTLFKISNGDEYEIEHNLDFVFHQGETI